jgi:Sigma-70, region 4
MARFDDLPADQKAVLQLVLRQGRTYAEIATLLKISDAAVQNRALTALDAIGPSGLDGLDDERQDEIGDYLLGQQPASERAATRDFLEASQSGRDWARAVAAELRSAGVAGEDGLPEIPADAGEVDEAFDALHARRAARAEQQRSSRLGGVLLIVAAVIVVVGAVLLLTGVIGGGDDNNDRAAATTTTSTGTGSNPASTATVEQQINLNPPGGGRRPLGVANIVAQNGRRAIAVVGQDLPASNHYVLWLKNGSGTKFLGFFQAVTSSGTDKGKLQGIVAAPTDLTSYTDMIISRESSSSPRTPTTVVLTGRFRG